MKEKTRRNRFYKDLIEKTVADNPKSHKVSERYTFMRFILGKQYPHFMEATSRESMLEFLKDVTYVDRQIRKATEGMDGETKYKLAVEKMDELEYRV